MIIFREIFSFIKLGIICFVFPISLHANLNPDISNNSLSLKQFFLISELAADGDVVGHWRTWFYKEIDNPDFSILNESAKELFSINQDGLIHVQKSNLLSPGKFVLEIKSQYNGLSDIDSAIIEIVPAENSVFIDPSLSYNGNGSLSTPFNSLSDINFKPGYTYFIKRNTELHESNRIQVSGERGKFISLASYGIGKMPVFNGTEFQDGLKNALKFIDTENNNWIMYWRLYNLKFFNWGGTGIKILNNTKYIELYNCEFEKNGQYDEPGRGRKQPGIYVLGLEHNEAQYIKIHNCQSYYNSEHGFKIEGNNIQLTNCKAYANGYTSGHGFQNSASKNSTFIGLCSFGNHHAGISARGENDEYINVCTYNNLEGITVWQAGKSGENLVGANINFTNVNAFNNTGSGISFLQCVKNISVKNSKFYNNPKGIHIRAESDEIKIENCKIYDNDIGVCLDNYNDYKSIRNVYLHYNLIYNNKSFGIDVMHHTFYLELYNNTLHGNNSIGDDIYLRDNVGKLNFANNIYGGINVNRDELNNSLDYKKQDPLFISIDDNNYSLRPNSPCINGGENVGLDKDINGMYVPSGSRPDIGAIEFQENTPKPPTDLVANIIDGQVNLEWNDNSTKEDAFILEKRIKNSAEVFQVLASLENNTNKYTDSLVSDGNTYLYRVFAKNAEGRSAYSNIAAITYIDTSKYVLSSPNELNGKLINGNVKLTWKDRADNENNYLVFRKKNNDSYNVIARLTKNTEAFTDDDLLDGDVYSYKVAAENLLFTSEYSNNIEINYVDSSKYEIIPPGNLRYEIYNSGIKVQWDDNSSNELKFVLYRNYTSMGVSLIDTLDANTEIYIDTINFEEYLGEVVYAIAAYNKLYMEDSNDDVIINLENTVLPEVPQNFMIKKYDYNFVQLSWDYGSEITDVNFLLERNIPNSDSTLLIEINDESFEYSDLKIDPATTYSYKIKAIKYGFESEFSKNITVTTNEIPESIIVMPPTIKNYFIIDNTINISYEVNMPSDRIVVERAVSDTLNFFQISTNKVNNNVITDSISFDDNFIYYRFKSENNNSYSTYSKIIKLINPNHFNNSFVPEAELISSNTIRITYPELIGVQEYHIQKRNLQNEDFETISIRKSNAPFVDTLPVLFDNLSYRVHVIYDSILQKTSKPIVINFDFLRNRDQLKTTSMTNAKVLLKWNNTLFPEFNVTDIYRSSSSSNDFIKIGSTSQDMYLDSVNLIEEKEYFYFINYSMNDGHTSINSDTISAFISKKIEPKPVNISHLEIVNDNKIKIIWADSNKFENVYIIERSVNDTNSFNPISEKLVEKEFIDNEISSYGFYYYRVKSIIDNQLSITSNFRKIYIPSAIEENRNHDNLIAGYNFTNASEEIYDISNYAEPINLSLTNNSDGKKHGKKETRKFYISSRPVSKILKTTRKSQAFSFECWIRSNDLNSFYSQQIIGIENENATLFSLHHKNFVADETYNYYVNFRTASTTADGKPDFDTRITFDYRTVHHIVYTRNPDGLENIYIDGKLVNSNVRPSNLNDWNGEYYIVVGGSLKDNLYWNGDILFMGFFDSPLENTQILQNYKAGPSQDFFNENGELDFTVYPNPVRNFLDIHLKPKSDYLYKGERIKLLISSIGGKTFYEEIIKDSYEDHVLRINLSNYPKGMYFLQLIGNNWIKTKRISLIP